MVTCRMCRRRSPIDGPKLHRFLDRHAGLLIVLRRHLLTLFTLAAVVVGAASGLLMRRVLGDAWSRDNHELVAFPGVVYLRLLNCLILPLVSSGLISSLGSLELGLSGRLAFHAFVYFVCTTPFSIGLGIVLVKVINPGMMVDSMDEIERRDVGPNSLTRESTTADAVLDLFRNLFTDNIVLACFSQYVTIRVNHAPSVATTANELDDFNKTGNGSAPAQTASVAQGSYSDGPNVLGVVMFCILLGVSVGRLKTKGRPVVLFFSSLFESIMGLVQVTIRLSPICVLFLVCSEILEVRDFRILLDQLGLYCATVLLGLLLHGFVFIPLVFLVTTRKSPFRFLWNQVEALATAFASASSAAAMPVSIRCLEENNGVHPKVARFVLPIGIINMQGTALYEVVSVIFIAQVHGVQLNVGNVIVVSVTAAAASMGSGGLPQAGLVMMVLVLNAVGLSPKFVSIIVVVDWLIDRFRTLVNVVCDSVAAGIVDHLSKAELEVWESLAYFCNNTPPHVRTSSSNESLNKLSRQDHDHLDRDHNHPRARRSSSENVYVDVMALV